MKKYWAILLIAAMLLCFSGCKESEDKQNTVAFYYRNPDFSYDAQCLPLIAEHRDSASFATLEETLSAYLSGPLTENYKNPFPAGLKILSIAEDANTLYLSFSDELAGLTGLELSLACCCIAKTCLELTDAKNIVISAETALLGGEKTITLNENNLNLLDSTQQSRDQ